MPSKESKWIEFVQIWGSGKTETWEIRNKISGDLLGYIKWYGPWRQYCFHPEPDTVFSLSCNDAISSRIADLMAERRKKS